jgi:hypothetical protein
MLVEIVALQVRSRELLKITLALGPQYSGTGTACTRVRFPALRRHNRQPSSLIRCGRRGTARRSAASRTVNFLVAAALRPVARQQPLRQLGVGSFIRFGGILGRFSRAPTYPIRALGVAATRGRPVNVARVTVWDVVDDVPFLATRVAQIQHRVFSTPDPTILSSTHFG